MRKLRKVSVALLVAALGYTGVASAAICIINFRGSDGKIRTLIVEGETCTLDTTTGVCACS